MCFKTMHLISSLFSMFIVFILFLFTEITCTQKSLQLTENVNATNVKQSYNFNEAVTMSCNYGFRGKNVTARCTDLNKWSENSPTCTGKIVCLIIDYIQTSSNVRVDIRLSM
jgi:hypothetical protein